MGEILIWSDIFQKRTMEILIFIGLIALMIGLITGGLIEFKNPSRTYTWTNNQEQPIMAVLDRILVSTNFEAHYPMANVKSTSRLGSDHVPLIINLGEAQEIKPHLFCFEKWWLEQKNLADIVRDSWNDHCPLSNPLDIW